MTYHDRAVALATAVLQIIDTAPELIVVHELEHYLRDELEDLTRQIIAEREQCDA